MTRTNITIEYLMISGHDMLHRAELAWDTWGKRIEEKKFHILTDSTKKIGKLPIIKIMEISPTASYHFKYRLSQFKWFYGIQWMNGKEYDWLVFVDDDTFIIHESLKQLLSQYDSTDSVLIGKAGEPACHLVCGGAGFAMSQALVKKLNGQSRIHFENDYRSIVYSNSSLFHSDVIISQFIHSKNIGRIIHREEFKNFPPEVGMKWYVAHNRTPSAVVSYHRLSDEQTRAFSEIYYNNSR